MTAIPNIPRVLDALAIAQDDCRRAKDFVERMMARHQTPESIAAALRDELIDIKRLLNSAQIACSEIVAAGDQMQLPL